MTNSTASNTDFSFEYAVSLIVTIVVCSNVLRNSPNMNTIAILLLGLVDCSTYLLQNKNKIP